MILFSCFWMFVEVRVDDLVFLFLDVRDEGC
jgi:hypothetical protein